MESNPNNINAWIDEDLERLEKEGGVKQAIADNYRKFWDYFGNDKVSAELAINGALDSARASGEIRWELHLRHWRLQLWITQSRIKEMLPEAIDLLSLAVDERVKDVPQRICAYNDVVACYVQMDRAGYYKEIEENSEYILGQLPASHHCADCVRGNMASAAAASGRTQEAERWLADHEAYRYAYRHTGLLFYRAGAYMALQQQALPQAFTLRPGEAVQTTSCTTNTTADHAIGQEAQRVTVQVSKTCSAAAYSQDALSRQATTVFTTSARPAPPYQLFGSVQAHVTSVSPLQVTMSGTWVYTFSTDDEAALAEKIAGETPAQAKAYLLKTGVIAQVSIPGTLPQAMDIQFLVLVEM